MCSKHSNNVLAVCVAMIMVLAAGAAPVQAAEPTPSRATVVEAPDVVVLPDGDPGAATNVDLAPDMVVVTPTEDPLSTGSGVSEAEEYFRQGVNLYKEGLYREALSAFNRAIALEPDFPEAITFRDKASDQLQLNATGHDPTAVAPFEVFDEEAFAPGTAPALSPQDLQQARARELMGIAARYLEHQRYATAVEIYNEVLLIDPRNEAARDGLHQATLGVNTKNIEQSQRELAEDRMRIREETERKKTLPPGADPDGIKPIRVTLPTIEENYEPEIERTEIEKTLESPVSIEFEDIHITEVVEFISDSYDVNVVIDNRVVAPPPQVAPPAAAGPAAPFPGPGGAPGAPGAFPPPGAARPGAPGARPGAPGAFNNPNLNRPGLNQPGQNEQLYGQFRTDGNVPYINLTSVTLDQALRALLRPLGLDFAVQPGFIWISTPQIIREETFEKLDTRFYELRNAGQQTLYKVVLRNAFGVVSSGGGFGGGRGGFGGGQGGFGGGQGGFGGGQGGFGGGQGGFGGGQGGFGGGSGGFGNTGGGFGGGSGGFGNTGGGFGGGSGGFGGGQGGFGGGQGGFGGGGGFGGNRGGGMGADVTTVSNISSLFSNINDELVGEPPANPGLLALQQSGTGADRGAGGGFQGANAGAGLGSAQGEALDAESSGSPIIALLSRIVPDVYEPFSGDRLSEMIYNPATNMLIVKNTPTNLDILEKQLAELDVTPRQVSIEAKFLTIRVNDLDKIGFEWDVDVSDQNSRARQIESLAESETYDYDINGDGVLEEVPFYRRPDGSEVIRNTITDGLISALVNPGPAESTFEFVGNILENEDGDRLGVTFDFLDTLNETELLSAPRVTTMNLKPAVIADLQTEYFITQVQNQVFTTEGGFGGTPVQSVVQNVQPTPFNFGISLSVTPQISDNDQVRLWLNPEVRTRVGEKRFTTTSISGDNEIESELIFPTTNLQAVWTNVIVHDGDTLVLGGLVQDQSSRGQNKMPYVADIPLLGFFFRGKSSEVRQSSLLIFVTPQVIDTTGAKFFEAGTA